MKDVGDINVETIDASTADDSTFDEIEEIIAVPSPLVINSPEGANWFVRRIQEARSYKDRIRKWAEDETRRAEADERRLLFLFGHQVEGWVRSEIAKRHGRRKSISLPSGTLGFRTVPSRVLISDEEATLKWARRACPSAVVVSERLLKLPISEHVQKTGEIPEGIEVAMSREEFFVR